MEQGVNAKAAVKKGAKLLDIAPKDAVVAKLDGRLVDLSTVAAKDGTTQFFTPADKEGSEVLRHSAAHIMARAVLKVFPDALPTIGPAVEGGFYYDFDTKPFNPEDLRKIEHEMNKIITAKEPFVRREIEKPEAQKLFAKNKYKLELVEEFGSDLTAYQQGDFTDLCRGPHVPHAGYVKAFKLTKVAGAYWRGNENNQQLQRLYGIAFSSDRELKDYLKLLEEAERRDHRKLGKRLELFSIHDEGPGFIFWLPKGVILKNALIEFWRKKHRDSGYVMVETPIMLNRKLWETSKHWMTYRENMYTLKIDEQDYAIKPMNCPGGMLIYKETVHSYREFPWRVAELGLVHRHEMSGVLAGLFRVRAFTQDDAHIYMTQEQVESEVINVINLCTGIYQLFGFSYHVELSTMPEKHIGTPEMWELSTQKLRNALAALKMDYKINEGDGAFYGPKIDFHLKDCIGRTWQCGTIQVDMAQPENFDLTYEGEDGRKHRPVMIHRTLFGSVERFVGILIEHYAGKFPAWINPEQVRVITVADAFNAYAEQVVRKYYDAGIRVKSDFRAESVSKKIREAQLDYVNYMLVIGENEARDGTVSVRTRENKQLGAVKAEEFLSSLQKEIEEKK